MSRQLLICSMAASLLLTLSSPASARTVQSAFTSHSEGWQIVGEAIGPIWEPAGGHPGGYVAASSMSGGEIWYWRAPAKFRGDHSAALGRTLSFDVRASTFEPASKADVILIGGGLKLTYDWHGPSMGSWTSHTIALSPSAGWQKQIGERRVPATTVDLRTVLANVEDLMIRGEGGSMMANSDLDSVVLHEAPDPGETTPAGDSIPVLMAATLILGGSRFRRRK